MERERVEPRVRCPGPPALTEDIPLSHRPPPGEAAPPSARADWSVILPGSPAPQTVSGPGRG
ncbi:hypothetical protein EYF80_010118 [Liparis tanakae]|uniref:Uncharacterized protein n=1 Tax=Liparis tanakae TaxID=230148 RepID=A0A4Z2INU2_9TELE|nr:hypothetical protein EYF80_010118 [Liparis tanakae]